MPFGFVPKASDSILLVPTLHNKHCTRETPYLGYLDLHKRIFAAVLKVLEGRQGQAIKSLALQAHMHTNRQAGRQKVRQPGQVGT